MGTDVKLVKRPTDSKELQDWITAMDTAGMHWVDAKLVYTQLDLDRRSVLADLMNTLARAAGGEKLSDKKLERLALAEPQYREYCRSVAIAEHAMLSQRVRYDSLIASYEAERTRASTQREIIKQGIYHAGR